MLKRENYTSEYILIPYCDFLKSEANRILFYYANVT